MAFVVSSVIRRMWRPAAVLAVAGMVVLVLLVEAPPRSRLLPECSFHKLTNLYCPGCGSTRALHALIHGRVIDAMDFNVLFVLFVPMLAIAYARWAWRTWKGDNSYRRPLAAGWIWALAVLVTCYAVARNLPFAPFPVLAP